MIRTCYRCPAFNWGARAVPRCNLGYTLRSYARPDTCKKKPESGHEMFLLLRERDGHA